MCTMFTFVYHPGHLSPGEEGLVYLCVPCVPCVPSWSTLNWGEERLVYHVYLVYHPGHLSSREEGFVYLCVRCVPCVPYVPS